MNRRQLNLAALPIAWAAAHPLNGVAQTAAWPRENVRLVVPFAAGGGTDRLARLIAQRMGEKTGKSFIVENKPGAGGNIGAAQVAKSTDGHTLLFTTAAIAVSPFMFGKPGYDLSKDLLPVVHVSSSPLVLVTKPGGTINSLADLAKASAAKPNGLNYASPGVGTTSHLGGFMLTQQFKLNAKHVAYRGAGPATTAVMSGEVDFALMAAVAVIPFLKNKQLQALGVSAKRPLPDLPQAPLLGNPPNNLNFDNWQAVFAPSSMGATQAENVNKLFNEVLRMPEVRAAVYSDGATPAGGTSKELSQLMRNDAAKYGGVVLGAGVKPE